MTSEEGMELWCMGYEGTDFCVDEDGYYECLLSADEVEDKFKELVEHCKEVEIPIISIHGLRHTHASLLLFAGVSIASVARRLGHSNMTTTQKTYLHIIQELESKDIDIIMRSLSNLN